MNDAKLARSLQSVGMTCIVKYFEHFASDIPREDVIEKLKSTTAYTYKSCTSRTSHARSIIKADMAYKALQLIIDSESPMIWKQ
jgi:hypothetical protein